jgi:hypothetical protein
MSWQQQIRQLIRQFQDRQQNVGWRIEMIPYDDLFKPMMVQTNGIALLGMAAFVGGIILVVRHRPVDLANDKIARMALEVAIGGFFVALFGIWFKARKIRKNWEVVTARCVDRELRKIAIMVKGHSTWGWFWRIICEYNYLGKEVRVTPTVYWSNFTSEEEANKFINSHISPDGECKLHINPKNPLQTELVGQGIADKLLY